MKTLTAIVMLAALALTGCATPENRKAIDWNQAAQTYYEQERVYAPVSIVLKSSDSKITLEGEMEIKMESKLEPISMIPRGNGVSMEVVRQLGSVAKFALGAWGLGVFSENMRPADPIVVEQPPPVFVEPFVVPGG